MTLHKKHSILGVLAVIPLLLWMLLPISTAAAATTGNLIINPGFETSTNGQPDGWQSQTYGSAPAQYGYVTDAHSGAHAVSITNSSADDEAGWTTTVTAPQANQRYQLSFWQKGTTYVYAYITETLQNGSTQTAALMSAPATSGIYNSVVPTWSQYTDAFVSAANIQSLSVTIATSGVGNLTLDDVALVPLPNQTPANFTAGMVSITLDDGLASQYANAKPVLAKNGFMATYYVNAGTIGTTGYLTSSQLQTLAETGNEIGSHLYHHSDIVELDQPTLVSELSGNTATLHQILGASYPITDFASPYGSFTSSSINTVMQYASSHRTTDNSINTKANLNVRQIHAKSVLPTTSLTTVKSWLAQTAAEHDWLVLVYHGVATTSGSTDGEQETITPAAFKQQMAAIKASGLAVKPMNSALTSLLAQE